MCLIRLPFNWRSVIGYVFATIIELLFFLGVLEIFVAFLVIYFGICQFCVAFATDIKDRFGDFKHDAERCNGKFSIDKQFELYKNLCKIIEFHSQAIQLSSFFNSLQNPNFHKPLSIYRFVIEFSKFYEKFIAMFIAISTLYLSIFFLRMHFVSKQSFFLFPYIS